MTLYKITAADGSSVHGGTGSWVPGEWREVEGELVPCKNGLHLVEACDLIHWLVQDALIWEVEYEGERVDERYNVVVRKARVTRRVGVLDRQVLVEFAADCAERAHTAAADAAAAAADAAAAAADADAAAASATDPNTDAAIYAAYAAAYAAEAAYHAAAGAGYFDYTAEREWQGRRLLELLEAAR